MSLKSKIVPVIAIGVLSLFMAACNQAETASVEEEEVRETPVAVGEAFSGTLSGDNQITGTTKGSQDILLIPKSAGQLTQVLVSVGDTVQKGQTLATIENREQQMGLQGDQNQLTQAQNGLERASNGHTQAEANLANAQVGYDQAERQLADARVNHERMKELFEEGFISQKELEDLETSIFNLEQQVEQAKINLEMTEVSIKDAEIAKKDAEVAVQQANIAIQMSQKRIEDTQIKAPVSGTIASIDAEAGEMVSGQTPFARIVSLDMIEVEVTVTAEQLMLFETGDVVEVQIANQTDSYEGTISKISPVANDSGLFSVVVQVANDERKIKPGMIATVIVKEVLTAESVIVPTAAVLERLDDTYVFVIEDNKAVRKDIEVIRFDTEYTAIKGEITPGVEVIVKGQNLISDGDAVRIVREEK